jgi:hypothetical protein
VFFHRNYGDVLLRCLEKADVERVLKELHYGFAGGHFAGETTTQKKLGAGYYWPSLFKDTHAYVRKCKVCQISVGKDKKATIPLQPVTISRPFE